MTDGPVLLVASAGGHLTQLEDLAGRFDPPLPRVWVTFDTAQSRGMLAGEEVEFVPYIAPRRLGSLLRAVPRAWRILRTRRPALVVSTGAAIALAFLPLARLCGIRTHYMESATRAQGPSLTGRLLTWVPGIHLHTQHPACVDRRWSLIGSVFDGFEAVPTDPTPLRRVLVTLGTMETYGFERLVSRLCEILPDDAEIAWQTGATDVSGHPIDGRSSMGSEELERAIEEADVVVAHAGIGTALTCLRLGKRPVLVPRRAVHGEHVDDHQDQAARHLSHIGLAAVHDADEIQREDLAAATAWRVRRRTHPAPISLTESTVKP